MAMRYPGGLIATSPVNAAYPSGVWTQSQTIPYASQNVWQRDQYWPYTTLLLHGDGTNGAQNNTFLDSSSNNFSITRNGNTTQGAFTPFQQSGYWSNYFDGTGDYLTLASGAAFAFGTGDFTVECFVYINSFPANPGSVYFVDARNSSQTGTWAFLTNNNGTDPTRLDWYTGSTAFTGAALTANTWSHIVYTRSSSTYAIFINGTRVATGTDSTNYNVSPTTSYIAARYSADNALNGYMSNLRVVKGSSVYSPSSSTLTIPTTPLTAITNTQLLTCQSNRFVDNSASPFTLTVYGTPSVQAFQPFPGPTTWSASVLGGSGYFDGSGDYLTFATNTAFSFGTGDFTIECWTYTGDNSIIGGYSRNPLTIGEINFYIRIAAYHGGTDGSIVPYNVQTAANILSSTVVIKDNAWHHIAFVRESGTAKLWVDGIYQGSAALSTNFSNTNTNAIGALNSSGLGPYNGYVSNVRVVKGTAVYTGTSNITVPTSPLTAISGTSVLTNFTNAGIFDNAQMNDLETVGNAQISTSVVKYGTGSMAFDGSGDYLVSAAGNTYISGTENFTIEGWLNLNSISSTQTIVSGNTSNSLFLRYGQGYTVTQGLNIGRQAVADCEYCAFTFATGTWYHIAVCRSNGVIYFFVNGVRQTTQGSGAASYSFPITTTYNVGFYGVEPLNGYLDDLRITKGVARYISNFTPPIARMPNQ